tara:strand:- start:155 stop:259 length:105 start_codon:yes stop_codon:yes gene_type:complete
VQVVQVVVAQEQARHLMEMLEQQILALAAAAVDI